MKAISYYRVSTQQQGVSGLGLEAQQAKVHAWCATQGAALVAEYTETESGKRCDRPELGRALAHARRLKATLVFAKLDRLARNARFLLGIVESGADVVFCDLPTVPPGPTGKFILTQMAAVAELEAGLISERTKAALAAYKARGGVLGSRLVGCHLTPETRAVGQRRGAARGKAKALEDYAHLSDDVQAWRSEGESYRVIAGRLNALGEPTRGGGRWSHVQVMRICNRLG